MRTIAFYISNHGFGHAARNIPIIRQLLELDPRLKIIVKTQTKQLEFIQQSLRSFSARLDFIDMSVDIGLVLKSGSLEVDVEKLRERLDDFMASWDKLINEEVHFLIANKVNLVVSDIVPWVFKSAKLTGIQSIFISNFTWVELYDSLLGTSIANDYLKCYNLADEAFIYPLAGKIKHYFNSYRDVGLSCREFSLENIKLIKKKHQNPLVYLSLGRSVQLAEMLDLSDLPYDFIYTEGIYLTGSNAFKLPPNTLVSQDYIKAADYVITKAGWSTIAEAICARKPMLVLRRDEVAEDQRTLAKLLELDIALPFSLEQLNSQSVAQLLKALEGKKGNFKLLTERYANGSVDIAKQLIVLA